MASEWRILALAPAKRYLKRLPALERDRILDALEALQADPFAGDVKPMQGKPGMWRLRIGRYRALLRVDQDNRIIVVALFSPRGDVYEH